MRLFSIFSLCCLLAGITAKAQLSYTFKASTAAYTPLTTTTTANAGKLWDSDSQFAIPVGFSFTMNGVSTQTIYLNGSLMHPKAIAAKHDGFLFMSTGLVDRGTPDGVSKSPIRYATSGTAGSRIFKMEWANAAFEDELEGGSSDLKDSLNLQIWIYEGSNAVEYRFGGSRVSGFQTYFLGKMQTGYVRNLDTTDGDFDKFFFLSGNPAAPTVDSMTSFQITEGLNSFPAAGQVYRFTPKGAATAVKRVAGNTLATVFPTRTQSSIQIRNTSNAMLRAELLSIDGKLILKTDAKPGDTGIGLEHLSAGQYLLRLTDSNEGLSETQRIEKL